MCSLFPLYRTVTSRQCKKTVTKQNLSLPMLDYVGSPCKGLGISSEVDNVCLLVRLICDVVANDLFGDAQFT